MLNLFSLESKVAIVTGAEQGLGQGVTKGLAEAGADIVAVGIGNMDETVKIVEGLGRKIYTIKQDLINASVEDLNSLIVDAVANMGRVDILVNNAGIIRREDALNFSEKDWDEVMDINLKNVFFLSQAFAKHLVNVESGGKIINIASMLSFQGGIRVPSYTASKSGVKGLTMLLANEWGKYGINVNALAPGYMATANTKDLRADEVRNAEILARIPAGRWGEPADLAGPCVFLASDNSNYINGYTIAVDGGWLSR